MDIAQKISEKFPTSTSSVLADKMTAVQIEADKILEVMSFIRDDSELDMDFLSEVTVVDYKEYMEAVYHVFSYSKKHGVVIKAKLPAQGGEIDSIVGVYRAADWLEREQYEMFGVIFKGHPDLRKLLLAEDFPGFPMRKDFPLENKEDYILQDSRLDYVPTHVYFGIGEGND